VRSRHAVVLALGLLATASCATRVYGFRPGDDRVVVAAQRPFHDLGIMREAPPEILTRAVENPYALPAGFDCDVNLSEIGVLDQVLGPDLRLPGENREMDAPGLVADVIGGAIGLPYSNIVRNLTGTAQRDRSLRGAILAGMVRRSFLRGGVLGGDCLPSIEAETQVNDPIEPAPVTPEPSVSSNKMELAEQSIPPADSAGGFWCNTRCPLRVPLL